MSRKFFKRTSAIAVACCILFIIIGGAQLGNKSLRGKNAAFTEFERLDAVFMNQLKINDAVTNELKALLREETRVNANIASVSIIKNGEKIFSAFKSTPSGDAIYSESKNLLLAKTSRNYDLEGAERYSLTVTFRILSEADINEFFFQTLILFLLLAVVLTSLTVIALKRKKSPAGPLFDEIEISKHPEPESETDSSPKNSDFAENAEEEEESFTLGDLSNDEEIEEIPEDENDLQETEEKEEIIDLDFKDTSFEVSADEIICRAVENGENCVVMTTEFKSTVGDERDADLHMRWKTYLSEHGGVLKVERKKIIAVFPRCTLTDGIKLIQDFRESVGNDENYAWNAGMTALNGRKMRYEEMLNEADRALIKSQLDNDNTVVCFNADAEKYNRYSKID